MHLDSTHFEPYMEASCVQTASQQCSSPIQHFMLLSQHHLKLKIQTHLII
jgi:hypothetical protein